MTPHRLRAIRAVEALEVIGTEDAGRLLDELANGASDDPLTTESKAALKRRKTR